MPQIETSAIFLLLTAFFILHLKVATVQRIGAIPIKHAALDIYCKIIYDEFACFVGDLKRVGKKEGCCCG